MMRDVICVLLILVGLAIFVISAVGNFRFAFVLNRMQISANGDTLGISSVLAGLIIANGLDMITIKLLVMWAFLWFANPVAGHFLAKTETIVNEDVADECEVVRYDDV